MMLLLCCALAGLSWAQDGYPDIQPPAHFRDDNFAGHEMNHGGEQHNQAEDHENFLGKERAQQFETLTPEQSIARLKEMIVFIDKNQDQIVDEAELRLHLDNMHKSFIMQDVERNWAMYPQDKTAGGSISWADYVAQVYDPLVRQSQTGQLPPEYAALKTRDERRWKHADLGKDGRLIKEEYGCFMHPQNKDACPHMRDVIALEARGDIDKDGDEYVSLEEFINFIYKPENHPEENGKEPEWVEHERKIFQYQRDRNRDGQLDFEEVKAWIVPADFDRATAEAKHLIGMADDDKDGQLQEKEMIAHYEVFVGSQVPVGHNEL